MRARLDPVLLCRFTSAAEKAAILPNGPKTCATAARFQGDEIMKNKESGVDAAPVAAAPVAGPEPITEDWLKSVGFKWHQFDRQPGKQWLLWLGDVESFGSSEDLGIELAPGACLGRKYEERGWFCWVRGDSSSRYHRFLHVRALRFQHEVIALVSALTGQEWNPTNHWYGAVRTPEASESLQREHERLDKRIAREQHPWYEAEKDPDRAKPTMEDRDAAIKSGLAK